MLWTSVSWALLVWAAILSASSSASPVVDCYLPGQCLSAIRTHLLALQEMEAGLAGSSSASTLKLQAASMALAERILAIADFLIHSAPHVETVLTSKRRGITSMPTVRTALCPLLSNVHTESSWEQQQEDGGGEETEQQSIAERLAAHARHQYLSKLEMLHRIMLKAQAIMDGLSAQNIGLQYEIGLFSCL